MNFSKSFEQVKNSVLHILVGGDENQIVSSCSGMLVLDGSVAITCAHCIIPSMKIFIRSPEKDEMIEGELYKINSDKDIVLIKFPESIGIGVKLRNSNTAKIGQECFVVGFPLNIKSITALSAHIAGFEHYRDFDLVRIDASINHGLSGGPLFNTNGELIGIVNAKHGSLSDFLSWVESARPGAMVSIGGIDPVKAIQQLIREMKINLNLNLGMDYAIPINVVGNIDNEVRGAIVP